MEHPVETQDRVIWRQEIQTAVCVTSETIYRWMRDGKLLEPDVNLSHRTRG